MVLHEDKKYYPSASEVYGEDVEALVQEEDTQPLTQPIVEPVKIRRFGIVEKDLPETRFERRFMMDLMNFPDMIRNVAVVGHLHHGKTSLMDMLLFETHKLEIDVDKNVSFKVSPQSGEWARGIEVGTSARSGGREEPAKEGRGEQAV